MTYEMHEFIEKNHCEFCRIFAEDERYRDLVAGRPAAAAAAAAAAVVICKHLGEEILSKRAADMGLDLRVRWRTCAAGHGEPAGIVKPCRDCGSHCPRLEVIETLP